MTKQSLNSFQSGFRQNYSCFLLQLFCGSNIWQKHFTKSHIKVFCANLKTMASLGVLFNHLSHSSKIDVKEWFGMANLSVGNHQVLVCHKDQRWGSCYIKDLSQGLNCEVKLFADSTSLFSIVNCVNTSASALNSDLSKMQDRT